MPVAILEMARKLEDAQQKIIRLEQQKQQYRQAIEKAMDYVQDGRSGRANQLYGYFLSVLEGET